MDLSTSTTSLHQSTRRINQGAITNGESQRQSPRAASIHIIDDDSILHVFYLCRPFDDGIAGDIFTSWRSNGCWWYTLAHVCQRWRNIIHHSATYLGISLVCTYGTPVADMLANSPPLPLVVGYFIKDRELSTEDEEGIILALKQRDRVRRVRLYNPAIITQNLFVAMNEEYPILDFLYIAFTTEDHNSTISRFPETFQAPNLRQLTLQGFALPIGSRLITTAVSLVTLDLVMVHPSAYFHPNTLLRWISLMPQLEMFHIHFKFSTPSREVERQLTHPPIVAPITFPNLHNFQFCGVSSYLEALVHRITAPRLGDLRIDFFNQLTFSVPHLLRFIDASANLRSSNAVFTFFDEYVGVGVHPHGWTKVPPLCIIATCWHLDWQVSSMAQISNSLGQIFSVVEDLSLQHRASRGLSEEHNDVERTEWRKLLRPFTNVKTLRIEKELVKDLSRCLQSEDGELSLELLPELQKLTYSGSGNPGDAFTSFIDARRNAGRPVILVRR